MAHAATDGVQAATPAQTLELADKALAAGQLSAEDRARMHRPTRVRLRIARSACGRVGGFQ